MTSLNPSSLTKVSGWKILVKVIETSIKASVDESIKERDTAIFKGTKYNVNF